MKNILIIAGSTSSTSINRQLANAAANKVEDANVTELVISELDLPLYSSDLEEASGIPAGANSLTDQIAEYSC